MKLFYITLNNADEAKRLSLHLLEKKLAACTNWFSIQSAYRWEGEIKIGDEVVLIVKTTENQREEIERAVATIISYTNFIAELDVTSVNSGYLQWLTAELNN